MALCVVLQLSEKKQYWKNINENLIPCKDSISTNDTSLNVLTHKQLETHGCALSTVGTDALVLKHQVISTHSAD